MIGRSVRADIQIEGDLVSRQHARFAFRDGSWTFEDLGSRNGSLLNNDRVSTAELKNGDVVMIGYGRIEFRELAESGSGVVSVSLVESDAAVDAALVAEDEDASTGATVQLSYQNLIEMNERLATIARISRDLATVLDREVLIQQVFDNFYSVYPQLDRAAFVVRDDVGSFRVEATRQSGDTQFGDDSVMRVSTSLIQFVQKEGKAVLSEDTAQDTRFRSQDSIVAAGGRSIMCAPLVVKDEFLGAMYLDTASLSTPFHYRDLSLLQGIAGPMAIFLKNAELVSEIESETAMRTSLSRYLSPDIVREIGDGHLSANLGGDTANGTIMFSDIVGFTAMSEKLSAGEVVERLNAYFTSMLEAIFGWEGTVDKFGGDAILAVWGAPVENGSHASMAVAAALDMQARLFDLNVELQEAGATTIRMAVGLNSGQFVAGNIGGQDRIEWTVIGDTVNTAQRVESMGFAGAVLVSSTTWDELGDRAGAYEFPAVRVKNRDELVTIHSVRALRGPKATVTALPVTVEWDGGSCAGVLSELRRKDDVVSVSIRTAQTPPTGPVTAVAVLQEAEEPLRLEGRIDALKTLGSSTHGRQIRVVDVVLGPHMDRLLGTHGSVPSAKALDEIER